MNFDDRIKKLAKHLTWKMVLVKSLQILETTQLYPGAFHFFLKKIVAPKTGGDDFRVEEQKVSRSGGKKPPTKETLSSHCPQPRFTIEFCIRVFAFGPTVFCGEDGFREPFETTKNVSRKQFLYTVYIYIYIQYVYKYWALTPVTVGKESSLFWQGPFIILHYLLLQCFDRTRNVYCTYI